jgi:hypothetical protein
MFLLDVNSEIVNNRIKTKVKFEINTNFTLLNLRNE